MNTLEIEAKKAATVAPKADRYFPSLNGLRGISILMVIIGHHYTNSKNIGLQILSGGFGVTIFFTISGFLITTLLLKERIKRGEINLRNFYIRRSLRIFPVAFLFLIVLSVLNLVFDLKIGFLSFLSSALYFRNFQIGSIHDWYTGHFWSLSVEEQFYLIFPFILSKNTRVYLYAICMLIFCIPIVSYAYVHKLFFFKLELFQLAAQLILHLSPILIGSLASILIYEHKVSFHRFKIDSFFYNLLIITTAAIVNSNLIPHLPTILTTTISSLLIMALILNNLSHNNNLFYKTINSKVLTQIGVLSYSLYVWQQLFDNAMPWENSFAFSNSIIVNLPALIAVSWVSYHMFEKKFLILKEKFRA